MRQILEEAFITCWQEAASLGTMIAPAVLLGPIVVLIASAGLPVALVTLPFLLVVYLAAYAACVRAAGFVQRNLAPDPVLSYQDVLANAPELLRLILPGGLLLAVVTGSAFVINDQGAALVALEVAVLGAGVFLFWWARHAYDQPLLLAYEVEAPEARRVGSLLARGGLSWTLCLVGAVSVPLLLAGLLSWGLAAAVTAPFGGAIFALALALWLPFAAFSLTAACARLVGTE